MKVFDLLCAAGHRFEAWFAKEEDYLQQIEQALLSCPVCGCTDIHKQVSAPRLHRKSNQKSITPHVSSEKAHQRSTIVKQNELVSEVLNFIVKNTEDVGPKFAEEARKIHYGEVQERNIRGQATHEEVVALRDEGVDVVQLPFDLPRKERLQ